MDKLYVQPPPVSKREVVNRLLANDFKGDLRQLGKGAQISRVSPNTIEVRFDDIDRTYLLSVHIPRDGTQPPANGDDEWAVPLAPPIPTTRQEGSRQ